MNVGRISGGTSVNVIASEATLDLDLRSEGQEALTALVTAVERVVREANRAGVTVEATVIGQRPAGEIPVVHPLVMLAKDCLYEQGLDAGLISGSTDANVPLSRGYPAVVLGITTGGSAHTIHEYINTKPIAQGLEQLVQFVSRVWS
jgi:acetylornithine deacetylase/succinyl-diaminopimelate desuccinylase-like protein